jgi:hypothetical protein
VPVAPQNRQREDNVGHTSRSSDLLHLKANRGRIFQSGLKTNGGATAGGARGTIAEVRRDQVEDGQIDVIGCVGPCYPYFTIFYVLATRSIVVF